MARIHPFEQHTQQYEDWFDENPAVYASELIALQRVVSTGGRRVEIGVGTGRFAEPLGLCEGVEPSPAMAERARQRGLEVTEGVAENLPLPDATYDVALMVTTICFVDDLDRAIDEMARILKPAGQIVFGFVDRSSPLGTLYEAHKDSNPFYRPATFYSSAEVLEILGRHGFTARQTLQTVFGRLDEITAPQAPREGLGEGGFAVIAASRG